MKNIVLSAVSNKGYAIYYNYYFREISAVTQTKNLDFVYIPALYWGNNTINYNRRLTYTSTISM